MLSDPAVLPEWRRAATQQRLDEARAGGAALFKHLLTQYAQCKTTAKDFTISCHFAAMAKVLGAPFEAYGVAPNQPSTGHYRKKLDSVLPRPGPLYHVDMPCQVRQNRSTRSVPTITMHEALAKEVAKDPDMLRRASEKDWPPSYHSNPLVQDARAKGLPLPLPLVLYLDGVRFTSQIAGHGDTVLGIWMYSMESKKRHLLACIRNRDMCKCGCRGWDSLHPILSSVAWSMGCLRDGKRPRARHDQVDEDEELVSLANTLGDDLGLTAVLLWVKGDWAEASHTLGLPSTASKHCPCPFCSLGKARLHSLRTLNFPQRDGTYDDWCSEREVQVIVANEERMSALLSCSITELLNFG